MEAEGLQSRWGGQVRFSKDSSGQGPLKKLWGLRLDRWAESVW